MDSQRCVGGLCTPRSSAVALGEPVRDFQAVETVLSSPDDMAEQLIVLAAQPKGVGLKRYYLPDYRIASDDIDEELGAFRVDTAIRGTLQLAAANRDPTQGLMRFAWAQQSEGGGVRSVLLDIKTPWISATETLYKLPAATTLSQLVAAKVPGGSLHGWVEALGPNVRPFVQFVSEDGTTHLAQALDTNGYSIALAGDHERSVAYWLQRSGSWWGIWHRETPHGQLVDMDEPAALLIAGTGPGPSSIFAANAKDGTLLFLDHASSLGTEANKMVLVQQGGTQLVERNYTQGFDAIEQLRVVPAMSVGAWAAVVGEWGGERGIWLRHINEEGAVENYPIRVLDMPPTSRIDELSVSEAVGAVQVSWAERVDANSQRVLWTRSFACD